MGSGDDPGLLERPRPTPPEQIRTWLLGDERVQDPGWASTMSVPKAPREDSSILFSGTKLTLYETEASLGMVSFPLLPMTLNLP